MKLKLTADAELPARVIKREWKPEDTPPLTPMPDCNLCGEPCAMVTPEGMALCGGCCRIQYPHKEDDSWHFNND